MSTAEAIRRHRTSRSWTKTRLARLVGVTPMAVTWWEDHGREPRPPTVERLEVVFGVAPGSLND